MSKKRKSSKIVNTLKKAVAADKRLRKKVSGMESKMKYRIAPAMGGSLRTKELLRHASKLKKVASRRAGTASKTALRGFGKAAGAAKRRARSSRK